ncbi:hypothetical protein [Vulcanococcus limneticus]|uniref:hypothetical protein n=1 Tax=Vulcanococcus limneticus TaxID=2170428 RepID=UPI00398BC817
MSLSVFILPVAVAAEPSPSRRRAVAESPLSRRRVATESPPISLGAGSGAATL